MGFFDFFRPKPPLMIPAADGLKYGPPVPAKPVRNMDALIAEHMPARTSKAFADLIKHYDQMSIEYPHLKGITVAQWGIESAWGTSRAARQDNNYAGMKWSPRDAKFGATPSKVTANDGYERTNYSHFPADPEAFINAYWARLDAVSAYKGWRKHTQTPITFISSIGPPWVYYHPNEYVENVISLWKARTRFLFGE